MKLLSFCLLLLLCGNPARIPAQDPDIEADERSVLEDIYRSSDEAGETPVSYGRRQRRNGDKRVSVPRGAFRIGCICMDDSGSPAQSIGACSGHGGVRYWLYRTAEGDTLRIITGRHERHPQPLDAAEMSGVAKKRVERSKNLPAIADPLSPALAPQVVVMPVPESAGAFGWGEVVAFSVAGVALFFTVRMLLRWTNANQTLVRYALRHLLRPRKRPAARKSRKTARKARV